MIIGSHLVVFAREAEKARAFLKETLELPFVDAGHGWLIFALPPSEIAVHPTEVDEDGAARTPRCEIYLVCDDIRRTVEELEKKGVEMTRPVTDEGWGLRTSFVVPGAGEFGLYEPRHPLAFEAPQPPTA